MKGMTVTIHRPDLQLRRCPHFAATVLLAFWVVGGIPSALAQPEAASAPPVEAAPAVEIKAPEKAASKEVWTDRVKVSGRAFLRFSHELAANRDNYNEFAIDRLYLTTEARLSEDIAFSMTLEGGDLRQSGTDHFQVTTKTLFLEVKNLLFESSFLRLGQVGLPWVGYEEGLWGYRFQGSTFADRMGYLTSTDLGVAAGGKLPAGYGNFQLNLVNGEGWKKREFGKRKDFHARLTLHPGASVPALSHFFIAGLAAYGLYDDVPAPNHSRERYIVQAGYRQEGKGALVADYLLAHDPADKLKSRHPSLARNPGGRADAAGTSIFGSLNLGVLLGGDYPKKWEVLARWDRLDPDATVDENNVDLFIGGMSHRWNKHLQTALVYERFGFQSGSLKPSETRWMLTSDIKL